MSKRLNWDKLNKKMKPIKESLSAEQATGYCARCRKQHPIEVLNRHKNGYYLCQKGYERNESLNKLIEVTESMKRLKKIIR